MSSAILQIDPKLDLALERIVDVPRELVWAAWTQPEHIKKWFTPAPWTTPHCEIDLRPGGRFLTVMRSPEGVEYPNEGCYLEVVPNERLVWTSALSGGYRPVRGAGANSDGTCNEMLFTGIITLEPQGTQTRYRAIARHGEEAVTRKHEEMGFHMGWSAALDQLIALAKTM